MININFLNKFCIKRYICFFILTYISSILLILFEPIAKNNFFELKSESITKNESIHEDFYLLGPGDVIKLLLFDAPEFSGEFQILNDGSIPLPLIGSIKLNNLSIEEASELIKKEYSRELIRPELHLSIIKTRPIKVSVIGEISRPGIYSLTEEEKSSSSDGPRFNTKGLPTIVDAIQKAGGITEKANLKKVVITRRKSGEKFNTKQIEVDLLDLILNGNHTQNLYLFDGDIIKLDRAINDNKKAFEIASANLSNRIIKISVIGQVKNPGTFEVNSNTLLNQSILLAGGPIKWKSNKGNVELIRVNRNGSVSRNKFKINLSNGESNKKNPQLIEQMLLL